MSPVDPLTGAPLPYGPEQQMSPELPPELMAMLGGAPPMGPPPAGASPGQEAGGNPADILKQMLDLSKSYMDVETDEEDKAAIASIIAKIQTLFAKQQRESDQAMGISAPQKAMRRTAAQGG